MDSESAPQQSESQSQSQSQPTTDSLQPPLNVSRAPTPAKTPMKWKGKTMIISLPVEEGRLYGEGKDATPLPLSPDSVERRRSKWSQLEQDVYAKIQGESRAIFPDEMELREEAMKMKMREEGEGVKVSIPNPKGMSLTFFCGRG